VTKKNSDITRKVNEILMQVHSKFLHISGENTSRSRLEFIKTKYLFLKINKLGKAGIINYFQGLDRENIAKSKEIQLFFLFIIEKYSENEFAEILYSLYKDPNNNISPYIGEIKPKKSTWRIINFLRALINRFKRKKFKIVDPVFKELYEKAAQENFKNLREGNIQYVNFKEDNEELLSQLDLILEKIFLNLILKKIFLIEESQNQGERSPAAPRPSASTAPTPQPLSSVSTAPAPLPSASTAPPKPPAPLPSASTAPAPRPSASTAPPPPPPPLPPVSTGLTDPNKRRKAAENSGAAVCDKISNPAPPKGLDMAELQRTLLALREKKRYKKTDLESDGSPEKNTLLGTDERGDFGNTPLGQVLTKRRQVFYNSEDDSSSIRSDTGDKCSAAEWDESDSEKSSELTRSMRH
jgi:hypothetical protein